MSTPSASDALSDDQLKSHESQSDEQPNKKRRRRSSSSRSKKNSALNRQLNVFKGITLLLLTLLVITLLTIGINYYFVSRENNILEAKLKVSLDMNENLEFDLNALKQEKSMLIKGIIPNLRQLELNKVIDLDDGYLKNITFSEKKMRNLNGYEYRLVLENPQLVSIYPEIKLYFFNGDGIQENTSIIGGGANDDIRSEVLRPGESTSYSAFIPFSDAASRPKYFRIIRSKHGSEKIAVENQQTLQLR